MYRCKVVNNDNFKANYEKHYKKNVATNVIIRLILANILLLILYFSLCRINPIIPTWPFIIAIILEGVIFLYSYRKCLQKALDSMVSCEYDLSFDENGIGIYHNGMTKEVKWKGVNRIILEEEYFIIVYKVNGIPANILCFDFFDIDREEVIKDIEKYIRIGR